MTQAELLNFTSQALYLTLILSLPSIVAAAVVGTLTSLLQALTQIQEQTLGFVLKLVTVVVVLMITGHWMGHELYQFSEQVFVRIGTR